MIGFGQVNCSLLNVSDVIIDNTNMTIDIAIYDGNTGGISSPFISYTIDAVGNTIQNGSIDLFGTPGLDTSWYNYNILNPITPISPLSIYFVHSNFISNPATEDTCILTYNISPTNITDINVEENRKCIRVIDVLGRETKQTNQPLFYIYDDGTVEKRIVIE